MPAVFYQHSAADVLRHFFSTSVLLLCFTAVPRSGFFVLYRAVKDAAAEPVHI